MDESKEAVLNSRTGTPSRAHTQRASNVLPVPGGPCSSTPVGGGTPSRANRARWNRRSSTASRSRAITSLTPATNQAAGMGAASGAGARGEGAAASTVADGGTAPAPTRLSRVCALTRSTIVALPSDAGAVALMAVAAVAAATTRCGHDRP